MRELKVGDRIQVTDVTSCSCKGKAKVTEAEPDKAVRIRYDCGEHENLYSGSNYTVLRSPNEWKGAKR